MRNIRTPMATWIASLLMLGGLVGGWTVGSATAAPDRAPAAPSAPVSADDDDDDGADDDDGGAPVGGVDTGGGGLAR